MVGSLECKDAKTTTKTELNYAADSPTSFKGTLKSTITSPNGVTTMNFAMSGKWLAASCPVDTVSRTTRTITASLLYNIPLGQKAWAHLRLGGGSTQYGDYPTNRIIRNTSSVLMGGAGLRIGITPDLLARTESSPAVS